MVTWSDNIPASGHTLSNDQPLIENNFTYLASDIGVDHNFTKNTGNSADGYHTVIHQQNAPGNTDPPNIANTGQIYVKTGTFCGFTDQGLFFQTGGGRITQLAAALTPSITNPGWVFLPGGLIMIYGTFNVPNPTGTINFPAIGISGGGNGFKNQCFGVNVTINSSTPLTAGAVFTIGNILTGSFDFFSTGVGAGRNAFYTAYGN